MTLDEVLDSNLNLPRLLNDIRQRDLSYLEHIQALYGNRWWSYFKIDHTRRVREIGFRYKGWINPIDAPKARDVVLCKKRGKTYHSEIIRELILQSRLNLLEIAPEGNNQTVINFSSMYLVHWFLVLAEGLKLGSLSVIDLASRRLHLADDSLLNEKVYLTLVKLLIAEQDPELFVLFFAWCDNLDSRETYICMSGVLLDEYNIWDEDIKIENGLTYSQAITDFTVHFLTSPEVFERIEQFIAERHEYQCGIRELFYEYREELEKKKITSHSEYVITELILGSIVSSSVLKYIVKGYIELE